MTRHNRKLLALRTLMVATPKVTLHRKASAKVALSARDFRPQNCVNASYEFRELPRWHSPIAVHFLAWLWELEEQSDIMS